MDKGTLITRVDTVSTEGDDTTSRVIKFMRNNGGAQLVHSLSKTTGMVFYRYHVLYDKIYLPVTY